MKQNANKILALINIHKLDPKNTAELITEHIRIVQNLVGNDLWWHVTQGNLGYSQLDPNHLHQIRTKIGKKASVDAVSRLGEIFKTSEFAFCGSARASAHLRAMFTLPKKLFLAICLIILNVILYMIVVLLEKKNQNLMFSSNTNAFKRWALPAQNAQLDCYCILQGDSEYLTKMAKNRMSCEAIKSRNYFMDEIPDSEDFPLAQARTIYKDYPLLEMELAATYSPQNWYCYVMDTNSNAQFKRQIHALSHCFPNILIGDERQMTSAGEGMTEAYLDCLTRLTEPSRKWKYVSLLQNHDTAIKTRTQIIQILQWMNGTNDAEIMGPGIRMNRDMNWTVSALSFFNNSTKMTELSSQNISLSKGSVAATLSRPMVEYVMRELNLTELVRRLNKVGFGRDELLFPTLNSADIIEAPGGASQICIEKRQQNNEAVVWAQYPKECTSNYLRHGVCVLGMEDLAPNLLCWPHMFANKFLPEFDLGASEIFFWYESLFNRTHLNSREEQLAMLDKEFYAQLPNVRFQKFKKRLTLSRNQSSSKSSVGLSRQYFLINSAFCDILTMNLPTQSTSSDSTDRYKFLPHRTMKNLAQNHWNPNDCHQKLHLIRPDCLKILCLEKNGNDFGGCTVRAKSMLSLHCGLFYYEVKIHQGRDLRIGLATRMMPLDEIVGSCVESFAYDSYGIFRSVGSYHKADKPKFGAGDTIGCGVNLATRQIIYTKNGERLYTANLFARQTDLYPCVTLKDSGDMVEANFGPKFKYKLQHEFAGPNKENIQC
uniref:B30.2/SPRY domain-containing protein n=1 Tax=Globodera rostochiensis TaxID=31243 RepID=A0A914HKI9_GLORO